MMSRRLVNRRRGAKNWLIALERPAIMVFGGGFSGNVSRGVSECYRYSAWAASAVIR